MFNNYEMPPMEDRENLSGELNAAALEAAGTDQTALEQQEMDAGAEVPGTPELEAEQREMDEGERLGYSSDYYKHEMEAAVKNGNKIAYENAKNNYAREVAKEQAREMEKKAKSAASKK